MRVHVGIVTPAVVGLYRPEVTQCFLGSLRIQAHFLFLLLLISVPMAVVCVNMMCDADVNVGACALCIDWYDINIDNNMVCTGMYR